MSGKPRKRKASQLSCSFPVGIFSRRVRTLVLLDAPMRSVGWVLVPHRMDCPPGFELRIQVALCL